MKNALLNIIFIVSGLFTPLISHGADITSLGELKKSGTIGYQIQGELMPGDFDKFMDLARFNKMRPAFFMISSPGGSVEEAMKFGKLADHLFLNGLATDQCNSSCFLLITGCSERTIATDIGIHRPFFKAEYFKELPFEKAQAKYNSLLNEVRSYLRDMSVPIDLIDDMVSIPSSSVKFIGGSEIESRIGKRAPVLDEWIKAKCGSFSDKEKKDLDTLSSANSADFPKELLQKYKHQLTQQKIQELERWIEHAEYAKSQAQMMSEGYRNYLLREQEQRRDCQNMAIKKEAEQRWRKLINNRDQ